MTRYFIQRPIAVIMTFVALIGLSVLAWLNRPVSLLPDIDVPEMAIRVDYANASPEAIENNILKPMRESLATMQGLSDLQSTASNENGLLRLRFVYGQRMDLAFVEVNEKIDRLTDQFPADMSRPRVIRVNYTDIPIAKIQLIPKDASNMVESSRLAENVIKKRIEQIEGISLVDLNGTVDEQIKIIPDLKALERAGLEIEAISQAIQSANQELGGVEVKDGQYQYYMRMAGRLNNAEDIAQIPVKINEEKYIPIHQLAEVITGEEKVSGFHFFNQNRGIVMNIHKQPQAVMTELMPKIEESIDLFKKDYPTLDIAITQDQSVFLKAGINNLQGSLLFGGLFAFGVLFLFMGSFRLPVIMGISLPLSLILSFLFFEIFGLSINIISLSGLALGLGMLIDNAIIVLENISRKRMEGLNLLDACVAGVAEVQGALISSVLTTLAVFVPLIFLSGVSGVLFFDQAVSVGIILTVSLGVSFVLLPLLYRLFFENKKDFKKEDSRFFKSIVSGFEKSHHWSFRNKGLSLFLIILIIPFGILAFWNMEQKGLPEITRNDAVVKINWNEPIDVIENANRSQELLDNLNKQLQFSETDAGIPQYLLSLENAELQESLIYLQFESEEVKNEQLNFLENQVIQSYPKASFEKENAKNAFDMLFASEEPYFRVQWQDPSLKNANPESVKPVLENFPTDNFQAGPSLEEESSMIMTIKQKELLRYSIAPEQIISQLQRVLGNYKISELKQFAIITPVVLETDEKAFADLLKIAKVKNSEGKSYALQNFVDYEWGTRLKKITADVSGTYFSINLSQDAVLEKNPEKLTTKINQWANDNSLIQKISGRYFTDQENLKELAFILLISVVLLYFILSAQFESFWQPLIVIFTLPFGILGAMIMLWIGGSSINIMSAIGMVVMLGIMVNDAILKVDTMNRNLKALEKKDKESVYEAIFSAGKIRLKPILMTSITTLLALSPVLLSGGLGAELQKPLVLAVMGGLTIGTFTALYFVPLVYYQVRKF
ncbi:efflux RND transporter permease subunit [Marivirga salinae]|uniref:Efflux RND transporter permease subunit n=1 Tax=Marivirga salinarum TaxID=3059078 RepID=A0AA51N9Y2_9BACT|nr:efflux RND transporter permease subunit [Marivirga sp. BDSF4-3]WMN11419.1 efflux RND transporter permease subunit [Marivirga sp. BDSF4-3]